MSYSGFVKVVDFPAVNAAGESNFQIVTTKNRAGMLKTANGLAFSPKIREYIAELKPTLNKIYALINAMGATEFYGPNINGDGFYEDTLKKYHHTFVSDGHPYMHHVNKDPDKCFGKVVFSDYNDLMHRVELVVEYDTTRLEKKWVDKLNNNELVSVSMGCRVPYDVCSICGNRAKSPSEYCRHLKNDPGLGKIMPDGKRAFAINTEPTFFDISIVTIPADPTARILLKVASAGKSSVERAAELGFDKIAASITEKMDMDKANTKINIKDVMSNFDGVFDQLRSMFDSAMGGPLPKESLNRLGVISDDPISLVRQLANRKIVLRPEEVQRAVLVCSGREDIADGLDEQKVVIENSPDFILNKMDGAGTCGHIPEDIEDQRSLGDGNIKRIIIRMALPSEKIGTIVNVPVSDSFRRLNGEQMIEEELGGLPTIIDDPIGALKAYLALGSIVSAYQALMGKAITPELLGGTALVSAVAGPALLNVMSDLPASLNAPTQAMILRHPDLSNDAFNSALEALRRQEGVSLGKFASVGNPFLSKMLSFIPAYLGTEYVTRQAKRSALEDAQYTGQYNPGFLSKKEYVFPAMLLGALKFASVRDRAREYVKTAETKLGRDFSDLYKSNREDVLAALNKILFP